MADFSLTRVQSMVAVTTGLITIVGAIYSFTQFVHPTAGTGTLVTIVQDAVSQQAVTDASVEVFTLQDALVANFTLDATGRGSRQLTEGAYKLRVSHPLYAAESRKVQVERKRGIEVRLALRPGSSAPLSRAKDAITGGAKSVGHKLGF